MHEFSVIQALLDQCEKEAKKAGAEKILTITLKVGKLSGIEPALLKNAFEFFSEDSFCKGAALEMTIQPVIVQCKVCGAETTLESLKFECKSCGSDKLSAIDGEDLVLMSLEME
ncbi:putative hydrogenase nickel incorporation protein HypA [Campylobacterota bacterium]|nr:putative hydrogenase nickel incorporation protein HypA [Campylobacterota bacterium]